METAKEHAKKRKGNYDGFREGKPPKIRFIERGESRFRSGDSIKIQNGKRHF
jgi:hypothetical protein